MVWSDDSRMIAPEDLHPYDGRERRFEDVDRSGRELVFVAYDQG